MLTFTQSQIDALNKSSRQAFIDKVAADLYKNEVGMAANLSHDELTNRVKATISCAKSFGLSNRYSLTMFTKLSFIVGPRFYKYPIIKYMLQDEDVLPQYRIDAIIKKMAGSWGDIKEVDDWHVYCQEFVADV